MDSGNCHISSLLYSITKSGFFFSGIDFKGKGRKINLILTGEVELKVETSQEKADSGNCHQANLVVFYTITVGISDTAS